MTLEPILAAPVAIQLHLFVALAAFLLGGVQLLRRPGDAVHRFIGRIWVSVMAAVALSAFFIHEIRLWGPWSPLHLLSIATLGTLVYAVFAARRGNIRAHRGAMTSLYALAIVGAGAFTLLPGRLLHRVVFGG